MKLRIPALICAVLAAMGFTSRGYWLPQLQGHLNYLGYIENETTLIGAPIPGRLVNVAVERGRTVKAGATLFSLDPTLTLSEITQAEAEVRTAKANLDNLLTGRRPEEMAVIQAQIAQTEASLALAQKQLQRALALAKTGTVAESHLDDATMQVNLYQARLAELRASEKVARLAARPAEVAAASFRVEQAEAQLEHARQRLADLSPAALFDAQVDDIFFKAGEWVGGGQPIVSLRKPSELSLRFFIPQSELPKAQIGEKIHFSCDGCSQLGSAIITRVADQPEFTPPVIYSERARANLVYLVEAKPTAVDPQLRPGLPIEVESLQ